MARVPPSVEPRPPAARSGAYVVYEFRAWSEFLVTRVFPGAVRLRARPNDIARDVERRIPPEARYFLFHLDMSVTKAFPRGRAQLLRALRRRGVIPLNADVDDITKRSIQAACRRLDIPVASAPRRGADGELLIVKTNCNYGGEGERTIPRALRTRLGIGALSRDIRGAADYRIIPREEVPEQWWTDDSLVVERYVSNRAHRFYRAYVVHERVVVSVVTNPSPIKKMTSGLPRQNHPLHLAEISAATSLPAGLSSVLARVIRGMSLDYGAIDLVEDDAGVCYVIDVNTTPYWGDEIQPDLTEFLAIP